MTINQALDLLDMFYDEMQQAEDDNEQMSTGYLMKVQREIMSDYANKIVEVSDVS